MLESVISLSEADNTNNNASLGYDLDVTPPSPPHEAPAATKPRVPPRPAPRFTKNPNRAAANAQHVKPKHATQDQQDEETPQSRHTSTIYSQENNVDANHEQLSLARKHDRPIYVARASYR